MKWKIVSTSSIVFSTSLFALGLCLFEGNISSLQAREKQEQNKRFQCTAEQLSGSYGVLSQGEFFTTPVLPPPSPQLSAGPFAAVGQLVVENQRFSLTLTQSFKGTIDKNRTFTGTFAVNNNCTGTFTLEIPFGSTVVEIPFQFVAVDKGKEIYFMRTENQTSLTAITGIAKKQED